MLVPAAFSSVGNCATSAAGNDPVPHMNFAPSDTRMSANCDFCTFFSPDSKSVSEVKQCCIKNSASAKSALYASRDEPPKVGIAGSYAAWRCTPFNATEMIAVAAATGAGDFPFAMIIVLYPTLVGEVIKNKVQSGGG